MTTKDDKKIELTGFTDVLRKKPLKLFLATTFGGLGWCT
jgi:hypothetical protein